MKNRRSMRHDPVLFCCAFIASCWAALGTASASEPFGLVTENKTVVVVLSDREPECVRLAVKDLLSDVKKITGRELSLVTDVPENVRDMVVVGTLSDGPRNPVSDLLDDYRPALKGKWEAYRVLSRPNNVLHIAGSDERGTMFGIYEFIETRLGVDPLYYWSDNEPKKSERLEWNDVKIERDEPDFKFRGWFVNDEDFLTFWRPSVHKRKQDYKFYGHIFEKEVIDDVAEAMVRGRFNLLIPASFLDILNPEEEGFVAAAVRRGLFVSQHHQEPLGVGAFAFKNYCHSIGKPEALYSYLSNPEELIASWRLYVKKWSKYPNILWQLGLRGRGDAPMWTADPKIPQTAEERGKIISDAIARQVEVLREVYGQSMPYMSTTLWMEGAQLHAQGHLKIPEKVIIVLSDNSPGWKWQRDFYEVDKKPTHTYGVYYHIALVPAPHLAHAASPQKLHQMISSAKRRNANDYVIYNVGNIREFVLPIDAASKISMDTDGFDADAFLTNWVAERFDTRRVEISNVLQRYFNSYHVNENNVPPYLDLLALREAGRSLTAIQKILASKHRVSSVMNRYSQANPSWKDKKDDSSIPPVPDRQRQLMLLASQRIGMKLAADLSNDLERRLPEERRLFFFDRIGYHCSLMESITAFSEEMLFAELAGRNGSYGLCLDHVRSARRILSDAQSIVERYCHGKWEKWYHGEWILAHVALGTNPPVLVGEERGPAGRPFLFLEAALDEMIEKYAPTENSRRNLRSTTTD